MPNVTTTTPAPSPGHTAHSTPSPGSHNGHAAQTNAAIAIVVTIIVIGLIAAAVIYFRRRGGSQGLFRRKQLFLSSLGTALLSPSDSDHALSAMKDNDGDDGDDDAIMQFDSTFDDHTKYAEGDRVVFDKYVGDTVKFEGGPQAEAGLDGDAGGKGDQRPRSVDLVRAKAVILEGARLQAHRELERERQEKAALLNQVESEREAKKKISDVNSALARQNLKLKTEFEKLKMEYRSREDELQNLEVNLDEHLSMKVPAERSHGAAAAGAATAAGAAAAKPEPPQPFAGFLRIGGDDEDEEMEAAEALFSA